MSVNPSPSRDAANRIGGHIKGGFLNYLDHWQEWILPMLVAAVVVIASFLCCWFPYLLVAGPVVCGLYGCAIGAMRNRPVRTGGLHPGWGPAGSSMVAWLFIKLVSMLPMILLFGSLMVLLPLLCTLIPPEAMRPPMPVPDMNWEEVEPLAQVDEPLGNDLLEGADEEQEPVGSGDRGGLEAVPRPERGRAQFPDGLVRHRPEEPPPEVIVAMVFGMLAFYLILFFVAILLWVWMLWFTTRTMFVLPLIADRRLGFFAALRQSWSQTRQRFWELLVINFAAGIIGTIGVYALYVGMLFTLPIYFTIIASVYEERFPSAGSPFAQESAPQPS